jgi:hypothetical protein
VAEADFEKQKSTVEPRRVPPVYITYTTYLINTRLTYYYVLERM